MGVAAERCQISRDVGTKMSIVSVGVEPVI
jgi:hypothetical protein